MKLSTATSNLKALAAGAALALCALAAPMASAATPGVTTDPAFSFAGPRRMYGWEFSVTTSQQLIGLGVYDYQGDGLYIDHEVGIWDTSGMLLASVIVKSSDVLISNFRFASITPFTLNAGSTYIVGAADVGFNYDPVAYGGEVTTAPGITYVSSRSYNGTGLHLPEAVLNTEHLGGNILLGSAVPEPATWAMMIVGFGAVGSMVRTSRRRNAFSAA